MKAVQLTHTDHIIKATLSYDGANNCPQTKLCEKFQTPRLQGNNCIENQNLDVEINPNQSKPMSKCKYRDPKLYESQDRTTEASEQADDQENPSSLYNNMVEINLDETGGQNDKVEGNTPKDIPSVNNPPAKNLVSHQVSRSQEK